MLVIGWDDHTTGVVATHSGSVSSSRGSRTRETVDLLSCAYSTKILSSLHYMRSPISCPLPVSLCQGEVSTDLD